MYQVVKTFFYATGSLCMIPEADPVTLIGIRENITSIFVNPQLI